MKGVKKLFLGFILTILTIISIGGTVSAKSAGKILKIEIPFEFYVKNDKLAAGKYDVQKISEGVFVLRHQETGKKTLLATNLGLSSLKSAETEQIVFNRYGKQAFLRAIYSDRRAAGRGFTESKTERKIREGAENEENLARGAKAETVSLTLSKQ